MISIISWIIALGVPALILGFTAHLIFTAGKDSYTPRHRRYGSRH